MPIVWQTWPLAWARYRLEAMITNKEWGFATLDDLPNQNVPRGSRCLLRVDLNVPMDRGKVAQNIRFKRIIPTIEELSDLGFRIGLLSHCGRPKGKPNPAMSLAPGARFLEECMARPVSFLGDAIGKASGQALADLPEGGIGLFENTRFHAGESTNAPDFAQALAAKGDFYVNDAFSASHRAHASILALADLLPCYVGRAMMEELERLETLLGEIQRPAVALVGGAKLTGKLSLLEALIKRFDVLMLGGGMANLFLAAEGIEIGDSFFEPERISDALALKALANSCNCRLLLPRDVVVARECSPHASCRVVDLSAGAAPGGIAESERILDIGDETLRAMAAYFETSSTLVWNGPLGVFETPPFDQGGETAARHVSMLTRIGQLTSVAGGGETAMLLEQAGAIDDFSHVSAGGGAFLCWLESGGLVGLEAARASYKRAKGRG